LGKKRDRQGQSGQMFPTARTCKSEKSQDPTPAGDRITACKMVEENPVRKEESQNGPKKTLRKGTIETGSCGAVKIR